MRIGRTLPPAAAPLSWRDISAGLLGIVRGASEIQRFKKELQAYFNCRHCFLVSSGKAALTLILSALKEIHPERDHVLIPAFTCYSVPSAIVKAGLKVRLCDIDPDTLDFDFKQLSKKLDNPRLLCVIPIHLFGLPADIGRLRKLLKDPAVTLVEDAAQAMGGEWNGKKLGTLGDVGIFSFGRGKALTTVEGGMILTDSDEVGERLRARVAALPDYSALGKLALFMYALALIVLLQPVLFWIPNGLPFLRLGETRFDPEIAISRMSGFQAGLARRWREKLDELRQVRQFNAGVWADVFSVRFSRFPDKRNAIPDLIRFPFRTETDEEAEELVRKSECLGLGIARSFPDAINGIAALRDAFSGENFPAARQASRRLVTLPVHGFLTGEDRKMIYRLLVSTRKPQEEIACARASNLR